MAVRRDDRNPGKWMIELRINRGKPNEIRKIQRNIKTEKEAKLLENLFLNEIHGKELVEVDISFGDAIKDFLKKLKSRVKPATSYSREKCIEKYILCKTKPQVFRPVFDFKAPIAKVTTGQLDRWREKILEQDISDGHKNALIRIMRDIFKNAKKYAPIVIDFESVLESVVVNDVITEQPFYEYEEYLQFEAAIDDDEWKMFFQTLYYTGARIGELQALTFADLLPTKEIYIYKSITSAAKKSIKKTSKNATLERRIGTPKNSRSIRRVLLPDFLYDKLLKY